MENDGICQTWQDGMPQPGLSEQSGLFFRATFSLRQTGTVTTLQIVLVFANPLASLDPAFAVFLLSLLRQLVQGRPVQRMVISELDVASHGFHQMARRHMLTEILVELHLVPGDRIDERGDQLEETPDHEGYYFRSGSIRTQRIKTAMTHH